MNIQQRSIDLKTLESAIFIALGVMTTLFSIAALNGGTAVTASTWDTVVTYLKNMMTSTWVLVLGMMVLLVGVWQLAHGGGYRHAGLVLGVLAFALIGPGVVTAMATATGEVGSITSPPPLISRQ
jgi:hypothetical protein